MSIYDWSVTPAENTSVGGIGVAEGMFAAQVSDAFRAMMAQIRATFDADMRFAAKLAVGTADPGVYAAKVVFTAANQSVAGFQNKATNGYSGAHFIDAAGVIKGHIGWANSTAAVRPNSMYVGTPTGGGPAYVTTNDISALFIDTSQVCHFGTGTIQSSGRLRVGAIGGGSAPTAMSSYGTVNYNAVQFVREISGTPSERGAIFVTDTNVVYGSASDQNLKEDLGLVAPEQAWAIVRLTRIHNYRWRDSGIEDVGPFAQELFEIYPSAVIPGGWFDSDGSPSNALTVGAAYKRWHVDNAKLIPVMMVGLQDIDRRLSALEG